MATATGTTTSTPCAACKFLRRKCTAECVFAPYFPPDEPAKFTCVHRVFGASNVSKILTELPSHLRHDAVRSLVYEADARLRDPVYGCVGYISLLQHRLRQIQAELHSARRELASFLGPAALLPICHPHNPLRHAFEAIAGAAKAAQFAALPMNAGYSCQGAQPALMDTLAAALSFTNNGQVEQFDGGGFDGGGIVFEVKTPAGSPSSLVQAEAKAAAQYQQQCHHNFSVTQQQRRQFTQPLFAGADNGSNDGWVGVGPSA